jgi:hypothetical protein
MSREGEASTVSSHGEARGSLRPRLVGLAFTGAEQDTRHLGQEVWAVTGYLPQLWHRGVRLVPRRLPPGRVALGHTYQVGGEQPVRVSCAMISNHLARIEHVCVKGKLAKIVCVWCANGKDPAWRP